MSKDGTRCVVAAILMFEGANQLIARAFEYIAATQHNKRTAVPGNESFTSALTWALENLLVEKPQGRFTTAELLSKIKNGANDFPRDQEPILFSREDTSACGRIMLHPLDDGNKRPLSPEPNSPLEESKKHTLTLHFDLSDKMDINVFKVFGQRIIELFDRNTFGVTRVRFGNLRPSKFADALKQLQRPIHDRRKSLALEQLPKAQGLITPTSFKGLSPFAPESEVPSEAMTSSADAGDSGEEYMELPPPKKRKRSSQQEGNEADAAARHQTTDRRKTTRASLRIASRGR